MTPFFSIILPVWNRERILSRAIASVRTQSFCDWELRIIDDGSDDGTSEIAAAASRLDSRIHWQRQERSGPSVARNAGLSRALGAWMTFLDSDDYYLPAHLEHRAWILRTHPSVQFLHGGLTLLGDEDRHIVPDADHPGRRIHIRDCVVGGTFVVTRGLIEAVGGWRSGYAEDRDLYRRLEERTPPFRVSEPTYVYDRSGTDGRCDQEMSVGSGQGISLSNG